MIICAKCGFTQPKDVYCANCGINIEKYEPEKPPAWIRVLKDPYFQISSALIFALAAFFVLINKPISSTEGDRSSTYGSVGAENQNEGLSSTKATQPAAAAKTKASPPSFSKSQNSQPKKIEIKKTKQLNVKNVDKKAEAPDDGSRDSEKNQITKDLKASSKNKAENNQPNSLPTRATYRFYEIGTEQIGNLFSGTTSTIEVVIVESQSLNLVSLGATALPAEKSWTFAGKEKVLLNYMTESLEDRTQKGIKFSVQVNTEDSSLGQLDLNIRVAGNIPKKEGLGTTFDWGRDFQVKKGQTVLVKVKLPHFEVPLAFLEESYNSSSPLSILSSPLFLEYKSELMGVITIE